MLRRREGEGEAHEDHLLSRFDEEYIFLAGVCRTRNGRDAVGAGRG